MSSNKTTLVIGIYFHPGAYPPTLNAITELSECFDKIFVVHRPHLKTEWSFPKNVSTVPTGELMSSRQQENSSLTKKIGFFTSFLKSFFQCCLEHRPSVILLYDSMSLLAYRLVRKFLRHKHVIWYHNHDVTEWTMLRKFSIGWFAAKSEAKSFKFIDIFSLPSNERKQYFPLSQFKGKYFFIPNYPAKSFYNRFYSPKTAESTIKLIFQGSVGPYHGIEEIITILNRKVGGHDIELILKGPCRDEVRDSYIQLAAEHDVSSRLHFAGVTSYKDVPVVASQCHIGIGILAEKDIMNVTLGTASNKLYEYAAVGLPVIYYDSENFTRFLSGFDWAKPAKLEARSIESAISKILPDFEALSRKAHSDFNNKLNFEAGFSEVKSYLISIFKRPLHKT